MMFNKVFISYAKEDQVTSEKLFHFLDNMGYEPWLDKKRILPGQDWNMEIKLALRKADFIVLLLSKTSVAKRGFVQREFKLALEYCEEKLDSDIYIIPCKIDDCEVPEKLAKYQWAELNTPNSFESILSSLNSQRKIYESLERQKIAANSSFEFTEKEIKKVSGNKPKNNFDIVYPQFVNIKNEDLRILNTYIEFLAFKTYENGIRMGSGLFDEYVNEEYIFPDNEFQQSYKIELFSADFISYTIFNYSYTGGAHGMYGTSGYSYRLNPLIEITLEVLLDYQTEVLKTLKTICKHSILRKFERKDTEDAFLYKNPFKLEWETFHNFYLKKDSIVIIFGIYQLLSYAEGEQEVEISFKEILNTHPNLPTLKKIQRIMESS